MYRLAGKRIPPQRAVGLFGGICLVCFLLGLLQPEADASGAAGVYTVPRQVAYEFTLRNTGAQLLETAEFRTYAPIRQTANQLCDRLGASYPFELTTDRVGNRILSFKLNRLPPHAARVIRITAGLRLS